MPCGSGCMQGGCMASGSRQADGRGPSRTERLEDALCSACNALEENGIEVPAAAASLWEEHKEKDEERKQRESANKKRAKLIASATSKLSKEEKDALGLR